MLKEDNLSGWFFYQSNYCNEMRVDRRQPDPDQTRHSIKSMRVCIYVRLVHILVCFDSTMFAESGLWVVGYSTMELFYNGAV